jgi:hypothetical protein
MAANPGPIPAPIPTPPPASVPRKYAASLFPGKGVELPDGFVKCIEKLQTLLGMPIWFIIQSGGDKVYEDLDYYTKASFCCAKSGLPSNQKIALILDSPGGDAKSAYQIARFIRKRCGGFIAVVPEWAKSAATLLALGADKIIISRTGELGPLDAQFQDNDREQKLSALDEVQALERLNAFALNAMDATLYYLKRKTKKTYNVLLPNVQTFVGSMIKPLFEKLDTVHYTQMSRLLKVAEEYAFRLLQPKYSAKDARSIARYLVHEYPTHDFFINIEEAELAGLNCVEVADDQVEPVLEDMRQFMASSNTYIGTLEEIQP